MSPSRSTPGDSSGASPDLEARCTGLAAELGLGEVLAVRPLSGGVASDIARVDLADGPVCMKFALPKLRVAADWFAPVHRSRAEYAWLAFANRVVPGSAPALLGHGAAVHGFAMEHLAGDEVKLWKAELLAGRAGAGEAAAVARALGRVHAASADDGFDASDFDNGDDFRAIRIEPYLTHTAARHPDLADPMTAMAERLHASDAALVHGDVSPKNVLIRGGEPVLLDAECATMGDPAFDVAFCLNHLVLKAFHLPSRAAALLGEVRGFRAAYAPTAAWEPVAELEARTAALLPMLMLARVDGKSPVEYLDGATRERVRDVARTLIARPADGFDTLLVRLDRAIEPT